MWQQPELLLGLALVLPRQAVWPQPELLLGLALVLPRRVVAWRRPAVWQQPELLLGLALVLPRQAVWPQPELLLGLALVVGLVLLVVGLVLLALPMARQVVVWRRPAARLALAESPQWLSHNWRRNAHHRRFGGGSLGTPSRQILSLSLIFGKPPGWNRPWLGPPALRSPKDG